MEASSSGPPAEPSRTLWAGSLPPEIDETFLYSVFSPTGDLVSARLMRDRQTGLSQGFAFLEFSSHTAAQRVLHTFDGKQIPATNQVFRLNWAAFGLGRTNEGSDGAESHSLFVGDLALEVTDLLLQKHFQHFFPSVSSAKVITERSSGKSKGYGFVRFSSATERDKALECMDGHPICNRPIRVSHATAKKYQGDGLFHPSDLDPSNTTAFVGNVNSDVTEEDLSQLFQRCGEIVSIKLLRAKGCAFVIYAERASAVKAIAELHGKVIKNCAIRLCWGRRSSQARGQLQDLAPPPMAQPSYDPILAQQFMGGFPAWGDPSLGLYANPSASNVRMLPSLTAMPQPGIFNAALQAASYPTPVTLPPQPHAELRAERRHTDLGGLPRLQQLPDAQGMPAALQALANLSLQQAPTSVPHH